MDKLRGWSDLPLSAEGVEDAHDAARRLKQEPIKLVLASDLRRSQQTALAIAHGHGAPLRLTRSLRPWSLGQLTGRPSVDAQPVIAHYAEHAPGAKVPPGEGDARHTESFDSFKERVLPVIEKILDRAKETGQTVLVVSHFRCMKLIEAWLAAGARGTKVDLPTFFKNDLDPGGIIELIPAGEHWRQKILWKGNAD